MVLDQAACGLVSHNDPRQCPPRWRNVLRTLADEVARLVQLDAAEPETQVEREERLVEATRRGRDTARPPSRPDNKVHRTTRSWHPGEE